MNVLIISGSESHIERNSFHFNLRNAFIDFNDYFFKINGYYLDNTCYSEYQPFQTPSLNSMILGSALEGIGVSYDIITGTLLDSKNGVMKLDELLSQKEFGVIAISTTLLLTTEFIHKLTLHIKEMQKESVIILGGPLLYHNESLLNIKLVDYFVFGDGEVVFPMLITEIINGNTNPCIDGVLSRNNYMLNGNRNCTLIDINNQPMPNWEKYISSLGDMKNEILPNNTIFQILIETTRGCPFKCAYCDYNALGIKARYKSAEKIYSEIEMLYRLGIRKIGFWDSTFTHPTSRLDKLLALIERGGFNGLEFSGFSTPEKLNKKLLKRLSTLGFTELFVGIESGNNSILKMMNKRVTREEVISIFEEASEISNIDFICAFVVGFPGENDDSIEDTMDLIKKIKVKYIELTTLQILKGSELYRNPQKFELKYEMSANNDIIKNWEHPTMNFNQAVEKTLEIFDRISLESESLIIAPLLHVTSLAQKNNPLKSNRNFDFLKRIQKGISLSRLKNEDALNELCIEIGKKYQNRIVCI